MKKLRDSKNYIGVRDQMSSSEVGMGRVLYLQWVCQINEEGVGKVQQGVEGGSCAKVGGANSRRLAPKHMRVSEFQMCLDFLRLSSRQCLSNLSSLVMVSETNKVRSSN